MSENLVVSGVSNEMSEDSERTRRSAASIMLSLILSGSLAPGMLGQTLLGPLLLAPVVSMTTQSAAQAQSQSYEGLPIKDVTVDANKQLVIVFDAGGSFPTQPIISELDTPHRLSLDFPNAVLDLSTLPSADALTARLSEAIPGVSAVRLSTVKSQREPIARIVLEFNEGIKITPRVAKVQDGAVTVTISDAIASSTTTTSTASPSAKPSASSSAQSAYEDYYNQFLTQKTADKAAEKEWGPRKGSLAETGGKFQIKGLTNWLGNKNAKKEASAGELDSNDKAAAAKYATQKMADQKARALAQKPAETATVAPGESLADKAGWDWSESNKTGADKPAADKAQSTASAQEPAGEAKKGKKWLSTPKIKVPSIKMPGLKLGRGKGEATTGNAAANTTTTDNSGSGLSNNAASAATQSTEPVRSATLDTTPDNLAAEPVAQPTATATNSSESDSSNASASKLQESYSQSSYAATKPAPTPAADSGTLAADETAAMLGGDETASSDGTTETHTGAPVPKASPAAKPTHTLTQPKTVKTASATPPAVSAPTPSMSEDNGETDEDGQPNDAAPAATSATATGDSPKIKARKLFKSAVDKHMSGNLTGAIADYKAAVAADVELQQAHCNLGIAYNQQHNYASALASFRKALAINPKDAIAYNGIGAALKAQKDIIGATKNWQSAVKLNPKLAVAQYNLGTAYEEQGLYDQALDAYNEAVKNDSRMGEVYYRMGLIAQKTKRIDEARNQFKQALKMSGNSDYSEDARKRLALIDKK